MSRYGNLGAFDYRVTNVPQYDLEADIDRGINRGLKLGQIIAKGVKSDADIRIARQKEIANQMAIDKIDATTREGFILKADDDLGAMNNARIEVGNMFVDRLNQGMIARNDGRMTPADFSKLSQILNTQVAQFKDGEKVLAGIMGQYMDSVENDNQSGANDPKTIEFLSAMSTGRAKVKWDFDEKGNMKLTGTWTDADGNQQPIDAALSKFEQLPQVLTAPEHTAFEQRQADIENVMSSQQGAAMTKMTTKIDPVTGVPVYTSDINPLFTETTEMVTTPDKKKVKASRTIDQIQPWFRQAADDSFNGYFDSLGKGDLRMGLKSYLLDSSQSGLGYEEVSALIDGEKDDKGNIIKNTIPSLDVLKQIKETIKEEYMFEMLDETHQANKLAVEKQIQTDRGNRANIADEERKIMAAQQEKNEMNDNANNPKGDGKTSGIDNTILNRVQGFINKGLTFDDGFLGPVGMAKSGFDYKKIIKDTGININPIKIKVPLGDNEGGTQEKDDPNNAIMDVPGGKIIKISREDLYDTREFIRNYFAALGIPNKATKGQPSIDDYLDALDFTGQNLAEKYNIGVKE